MVIVIAAVGGVLMLIAVLIGAITGGSSGDPTARGACLMPASSSAQASGVGLDPAQIENAAIIVTVAAQMNLTTQAAVIAVATALQESDLRNLAYGDRDSLGLFQQRPSQGWGTAAQIIDPAYAAHAFYARLVEIPGWQELPLTVAAQEVQHSGNPGAYAQWQDLATRIVTDLASGSSPALLTDGGAQCPDLVPVSGTTTVPSWYQLPAATPAPVVAAITFALRQLGRPYLWGGTGPVGFDCSGLVMMAYRATGIDLPRTTFEQVHVGAPVPSLDELEPGDLLFAAGSDGTADNPGHVGMHVGDGLVVQAPEQGEPVQLDGAQGWWVNNTVAIRRISS